MSLSLVGLLINGNTLLVYSRVYYKFAFELSSIFGVSDQEFLTVSKMAGQDETNGTEDGIADNNDIEPVEQNEENVVEECIWLDSKLDELNSALDYLEQKNDDIQERLKELLQSSIDIREEIQNEKNKKQ